jgi:hypothetical protein
MAHPSDDWIRGANIQLKLKVPIIGTDRAWN